MSDSGEFGEEEVTLLDFAREGEIEPFAELLQTSQGADSILAAKDEFSQANVLHMAAANGHSELLKYVLDNLPEAARKQLASAGNESGNTPMHWAALTGSLDSVKLLVDAGADPLAKNIAGIDPIYQAENAGQEDIASYLCSIADLSEFKEDTQDQPNGTQD